jgi:hypothetical protein
VPHAARGLRRIELHTGAPEPVVEFYAGLLGWAVLSEPSEVFGGWVGDRLAVRVLPGPAAGWRLVFSGTPARALSHGASVDQGRVLHGPWAPPPRPGEPCWVELMGVPDAGDVATELGWLTRTPGEPFEADLDGTSRPVAGNLAEGPVKGWMPYFAVPDVAEAAATAPDLGGTVLVPPTTVPTGLATSIADPAGTVATLLQSPAAWGGTLAAS